MKFVKRVRNVELGREIYYDLFLPETGIESLVTEGLLSVASSFIMHMSDLMFGLATKRGTSLEAVASQLGFPHPSDWVAVQFRPDDEGINAMVTTDSNHEEWNAYIGLACPQAPKGVGENEPYGAYDNEGSIFIVMLGGEGKLSRVGITRQSIRVLVSPTSVCPQGRARREDVREEELAEALEAYTDPASPQYDAEFDKKIRTLRPDWFADVN